MRFWTMRLFDSSWNRRNFKGQKLRYLLLLDNSGHVPGIIAFGKGGNLRIIRKELFEDLVLHYGRRK
jgi:hypothetical protein